MNLSQSLRDWYSSSARNLPWRNTTDPYPIWLSEIILQQTRVAQGLPYFERFLNTFPTVHNLANAEPDQVMKLWEGLGYYSRARNLHKGAKYISEHGFPNSYEEWLKVPGVGPYTASAVSSFAFNEERAVVDGNVHRVLSRLMALELPVNSTEGGKRIQEKADELIKNQPPAEHNQAIMELGALICTPKSPSCNSCPWVGECLAHLSGKELQFPIKLKKTKVKERSLEYIAIFGDTGMFLKQRVENDIWKELYEFPSSTSEIKSEENLLVEKSTYSVNHLLSHRKLTIEITKAEWRGQMPENFHGYELYRWSQIQDLAFPKPLRHWLDNNLLPLYLDSDI